MSRSSKSQQRMPDSTNQRPLSHYVKVADAGREEGNSLSDDQREAMVREALALIHGRDKDKTSIVRRS